MSSLDRGHKHGHAGELGGSRLGARLLDVRRRWLSLAAGILDAGPAGLVLGARSLYLDALRRDVDGRVLSDESLRTYDPEGSRPWETLNPAVPLEECRPQCLVVAMLLADKSLADRLLETQAAGQPGIPVEELLGYMEEAAKGIDFLNLKFPPDF